MQSRALSFLRCPLCGESFQEARGALRCPQGHSFDIARQGYVDLVPGGAPRPQADTSAMVAAREAFLAAGHFARLRERVAEAAARALGAAASARTAATALPCVVEAGAGTAYYLSAVLDRLSDRVGVALDLSKFATRRAARAHPRIVAAVVSDVWKGLPLAGGCADLVLNVFAPRNAAEFRRVLTPQGRLLAVWPTHRHLQELVEALDLLTVDKGKEERLHRALATHFNLVHTSLHEEQLALTLPEIALVARMGPSAYHLTQADLSPGRLAERLADLTEETDRSVEADEAALTPRYSVTLSVTLAEYAPAGGR